MVALLIPEFTVYTKKKSIIRNEGALMQKEVGSAYNQVSFDTMNYLGLDFYYYDYYCCHYFGNGFRGARKLSELFTSDFTISLRRRC